MKKFFLFLLGFLIGTILFMPKDNLYFTAQKFLAKENIYINSSVSNGFYLTLQNGKIYQNGINISDFESIKILPLLLYNEIKLKNLKLNIGNYKIKNAKITYSILNPVKICISGISSFGKIEGEISLIKRFVKIYILNLSDSTLQSFLKKDKKGYFYYANF